MSSDRQIFGPEHEAFRSEVRKFVEREVIPFHHEWEVIGCVDRDLWRKAGLAGILCPSVEEQYGGPGGDFLHSAVVLEEFARAFASGPGFFVHSEMIAPYLSNFGTAEQKERWLPRLVSGDLVGAVAMTEPGMGSDLRGMKTYAVKVEGGWRLNGQKVFISNGQQAGLVVVAAKADREDKKSLTLFLVDAENSAGFTRGRNLQKIGYLAQDTSELFFDDVFVSDQEVLGGPGQGFKQLLKGLGRERLAIGIMCQAKAEAAVDITREYVRERQVFGQDLSEFQNTRFKFAEMQTELKVGRTFVDSLLANYMDGQLSDVDAAMCKLWCSEMLGRVVDTCLQMHGGWGYMSEYVISRAYVDSRIERIAGGTSEIMKEVIGRAYFAEAGT